MTSQVSYHARLMVDFDAGYQLSYRAFELHYQGKTHRFGLGDPIVDMIDFYLFLIDKQIEQVEFTKSIDEWFASGDVYCCLYVDANRQVKTGEELAQMTTGEIADLMEYVGKKGMRSMDELIAHYHAYLDTFPESV